MPAGSVQFRGTVSINLDSDEARDMIAALSNVPAEAQSVVSDTVLAMLTEMLGILNIKEGH